MERRIRIIFGVNDFLVGGMQRQLTEQLKLYDATRFDIQIITLFSFPGRETMYDLIPTDIPVRRFAFKGWWDIRSWFALRRLLREQKPDVVVSSLFFSNTVFRVLRLFDSYISIAREHNTYTNKSFAQRFIDRMLAHVSYRIVAVSSTVATFTASQERIPEQTFVVIHNGIDSGAVRNYLAELPPRDEVKRTHGFSPTDKILLSVARLMPQKNHSLLMHGFAQFHSTHPEYRLALVGDGPLLHELESLAQELGISEYVTFFGYQKDVWQFYAISDVLVSTSDIEGLSNAMLEALAAGVPLVATRTAGTDELIIEGKNGLFIQEATPECVDQTLSRFADMNTANFAAEARTSATAFDIHATVSAYEKLFTECVTP